MARTAQFLSWFLLWLLILILFVTMPKAVGRNMRCGCVLFGRWEMRRERTDSASEDQTISATIGTTEADDATGQPKVPAGRLGERRRHPSDWRRSCRCGTWLLRRGIRSCVVLGARASFK